MPSFAFIDFAHWKEKQARVTTRPVTWIKMRFSYFLNSDSTMIFLNNRREIYGFTRMIEWGSFFPSRTGGARGGWLTNDWKYRRCFYKNNGSVQKDINETWWIAWIVLSTSHCYYYDPTCILPWPGKKRNVNYHCFESGVLQYDQWEFQLLN